MARGKSGSWTPPAGKSRAGVTSATEERDTKSGGDFPTQGTSASRVRSPSPPSPNLQYKRKQNAKGGSIPDAGTKQNRQGELERNGFKGAPQVTYVYPQAPEASLVQRNVKVVPSSVGNRDFWDKRKYGQALQ